MNVSESHPPTSEQLQSQPQKLLPIEPEDSTQDQRPATEAEDNPKREGPKLSNQPQFELPKPLVPKTKGK